MFITPGLTVWSCSNFELFVFGSVNAVWIRVFFVSVWWFGEIGRWDPDWPHEGGFHLFLFFFAQMAEEFLVPQINPKSVSPLSSFAL